MSDGLLWASFLLSKQAFDPPFRGSVVDGGVTRYSVQEVKPVRGHFRRLAEPGWELTRVESRAPVPLFPCDELLSGVTQHLGYTTAVERDHLTASSRRTPGRLAVLIPIAKSAEWWAMAHDQRRAYMAGKRGGRGHIDIGGAHAGAILRKLYHARYLPRSEWDFVTYFELDEEDRPTFLELLRLLRDPKQNPEWTFVEREVEIWTRKT